jgi:DNA invertase Pin-like site-specific DNA recombinase
MEKAVGYIRVSTDDQSNSLEMQKQRIEDYCRFKGLVLDELFIDEDVSGSKPLVSRPAGSRLSERLADDLRIKHVIALKLDRVFRKAVDALKTNEEWDEAGIAMHLVDMGGQIVDTSTPMGKMMLTMLSGFAEWERNVIASRTSEVLSYKKSSGKVYCGSIFGFNKENGDLVVNEEEMAIVKDIYEFREIGFSMSSIASILNDRGVKTKKNGTWHSSTISAILKNEIYKENLSL